LWIEPEVLPDGSDRDGVLDDGDDPAAAAALGTVRGIDGEDPAK
jgi:hypothetical protein